MSEFKVGQTVRVTVDREKNLYAFHGEEFSSGKTMPLKGVTGTITDIVLDDEAPPITVKLNLDLPAQLRYEDFHADELEAG